MSLTKVLTAILIVLSIAVVSFAETFSFAVIPDTQQDIVYNYPMMTNRMNWLVANKDSLNLKWVMCSGDYIDWDTPDHIHYQRGSEAAAILESAGLSFINGFGNHDSLAVCPGGSACPGDVNANLRNTSLWNVYFPVGRFANLRDTFESGKSENACHTFSAGGLDWLIINIELWPRAGAVAWAKDKADAYPDHNVVVVTHMYLDSNGNISSSNGGYGNNSPQYMWNNFIKLCPNIRMVFNGHTGSSAHRTDTGVNGNTIHSILQTYHDNTNNVTRIVEVDTAAGSFSTYVYAPNTDIYKTGSGAQFTATGINWVPAAGGGGTDYAPNVTLTTPSNGDTVSGGTYWVNVSASDDNGVSKVEFYVDSILQSTDMTNPYSWGWDTTQYADGGHTVKAVAYDTANQTAISQVSVTVSNGGGGSDNVPNVTLTAPVNGATVSGNIYWLNASASDDNGISKVEFYIDNVLYATDPNDPYSWGWDTTKYTDGAHTVKAMAYDTANQTAISQVSVTVNNTDTPEPEPEPDTPDPGQVTEPAEPDPFEEVSVKGSVLRENSDVVRFEGVPAQAELSIYTLTGKLVASLNESYFSGGVIDWDGLNRYADNVRPGIYIYVLADASGNRKSGKVVIGY